METASSIMGLLYMCVVRHRRDDHNGLVLCFFFQAEDGIRYLVRSRGLGDVYKRQVGMLPAEIVAKVTFVETPFRFTAFASVVVIVLPLSLIHI